MRKSAPVHVIVHRPATDEERAGLACRAAAVHADAVADAVGGLACPLAQKLALLEAVIRSAGLDETKRAEPPPEGDGSAAWNGADGRSCRQGPDCFSG